MFKKDALIVLVDDMEAARELTRQQLEELGYTNISMAPDGQEALNSIGSFMDIDTPPELIISDWMMPGISGLEMLEEIRANPRTAHIPFLMITAEGETQQVIRAIKSGVSDYIVKPFDTQTLFKKLTNMLDQVHRVT